jgi:staphylococcal nuclease domain-containing protein 1
MVCTIVVAGTDGVAIIEATPAADRFRARLVFPDGSQQIIPVVLAGVRSPSASKKAGAGDDVPGESGGQAEEFGDEARWFVESKLLQREVKVEIMHVPHYFNLISVASINRAPCLLPRSNILPVILHSC